MAGALHSADDDAAQAVSAGERGRHWFRWVVSLALAATVAVAAFAGISDPLAARAAAVAGVCLIFWLSEVVPLYATTLLLWTGTILLLGPIDPARFSVGRVLSVMGNPVLALFFGGFTLSAAGAKHGIDRYIAGWMIRLSRGSRRGLLLTVMLGTAVLSMWMSNIAAAAMVIATLRPLISDPDESPRFRIALLLGVAFAADFGGMATPVGTGPNLVVIAALSTRLRITFVQWMAFGVPAAGVMLLLTYGLLVLLHGVRGRLAGPPIAIHALSTSGWTVVVIFSMTVLTWLTEPFHGVPAAAAAVACSAALFSTQLLTRNDLRSIEWDTLLLIAGGLTLGLVFEDSGLAAGAASIVHWDALPGEVVIVTLIAGCAMVAAIASNTATSVIMVQLAMSVSPSPTIAVLTALGASLGVPFVISTPPNAMAYGQGGLRSKDMFIPGLILMAAGCLLLASLGPWLLRLTGIR